MCFRLCLPLVILVSGCTTLSETYLQSAELVRSSSLVTTSEIYRSSRWVLARQTHFYVARNNALTDLNSRNSDSVTKLLQEAIQESFTQPTVGILPESMARALASADRVAADFLIFPSIMVWDDRASTWVETFASLRSDGENDASFRIGLDKAQLQLVVMHAASGKVFDVVRIDSHSGLLTLYEDTPGKVVLPSLKSFFAGLVAASG